MDAAFGKVKVMETREHQTQILDKLFDNYLLSFRTLRNNVVRVLEEVENLQPNENDDQMVLINRCTVYLIFTMVKDRRFQLNTDEVELLI